MDPKTWIGRPFRIIDARPTESTNVKAWSRVTFFYDSREDRILAAINAGKPDPWSGWLTRRLALTFLERTEKLLASTLALAQQVPADVRDDVVAFDRDNAMAQTERGLYKTSGETLKAMKAAAELVQQATVTKHGNQFRIELQDQSGDGAGGMMARADLQRILQLLQAEIQKTDWTAYQPSRRRSEPSRCRPSRRVIDCSNCPARTGAPGFGCCCRI